VASQKSSSRVVVFVRAKLGANRTFTAIVALCWVVHRAFGYPLEYLTHLDRDIWWLQIGTWLEFAAEGWLLGAGATLFASLVRAVFSRSPLPPFGRIGLILRGWFLARRAPLVLGIISAAVALYVWRLHPVAIVHDESAYLLQAKLFASGRWKGNPAPIPEFFEQMYTFVTPFTAAKYFPGFSAALVPGIWLKLPVIVPILLFGLSGGLLFSISRTIANETTAALAWMLWTTTPHAVWVMPPFMSQQLTNALILASWWALLRWRATIHARWLLLIAGCMGLGAITRPLTMFVAAIPILPVVLWIGVRRAHWQLLLSGLLGVALLAVIPVWSRQTTGNWKMTPLALHVRWYTPYDGLGFGWKAPPPARPLPRDLAEVTKSLGRYQRRHTIDRLPTIIVSRIDQIRGDALARWRVVLVPFAIYGLFVSGGEAFLGAATCLLNFLAYLLFAHPVNLTVYYVESYTVIAFLAAAGASSLLLDARRSRELPMPPSRQASLAFIMIGLAAMEGGGDLYRRHLALELWSARKARFVQSVDAIREPAIVFVRYGRGGAFANLVENGPDIPKQRVWIARDLEEENSKLIAVAPERKSYLWDDSREALLPYRAGGS